MFAAHNTFLTGSKVITPPTIKGAASAWATYVAIPSHNAGDIIVMFASNPYTAAPTKPAASGNVPTWIDIDNKISTLGARTAYAVATTSSTESGAWTSATILTAIVLSGQKSTSPIGGHDVTTSASAITAPAVTLSKTDGSSQLLHFGHANSFSAVTFATVPSGYTSKHTFSAGAYNVAAIFAKNVTTSDGAVTLNGASAYNWTASASVEILAP